MKRKLLFAMLCIAGALGMNAQTWTNSDLANGRYVFQNVGSGRYLGPGNSWGTQASLIECSHFNTLAKISDGVYTIESQVSNGGTNYYFTGSYMDGGAVNVTIQDNGNGIYTMSNGSTYYGYNGSSTVLASNLTDPTSTNAQWKVMAYDEVYADASETNPVDVSYMILDANFDRNNRNGGGDNNDLGNKWTMVASNQNLCGGDNTNRCAESWRAAFTLSQTITVPNGYYKLRAQAALTDYASSGANWPVVYATSGANTVTAVFKEMTEGEASMSKMSEQFTAGKYWTDYTDVITVTNGSLTVGVKGTRTDTWCIWDNFNLLYMGPIDLSSYATELANAVAAAQAYQSQVPAAVYASIQDVITANNQTYSTEDDYIAAINAINDAVSTYATAAIISDYSRYQSVKAAVLALDDDATIFTGNASVDVADADTAVEAATTAEGVENAISMLRADAATFLGAVTVNSGKFFTITSVFLENADFSALNINGWETNYVSGQQANNIGYQANNTYTNGEVSLNQFIEAWRSGNAAIGDGYLRQTVSNLPEGKYTLEADAIAVNQGNPTATATGAYLYINAAGVDYKTSMSTTYDENQDWKPQHFSAEFLSPGDVDVTFGLKTESTSVNWIAADNFVVKFYGIDLSPYVPLLAEAVSEAQALQGTIPTAAYTALNNVVTTNNQQWTTSADYTTAIAAIQEATATAKALQANYTRYTEIKTAVLAAASNTDVANADSQVNAATTSEAIEAAIVTLRAALITALPNATIPAAGYIDVTDALIDNASVRQNTNYWTIYNYDGFPNTSYSNGVTNFEETEFYQQQFKFYQLLALGTGTWEFGVTGFHRAGNHSTYFYAGEDKILIPGVESNVVNTMEAAKTYFDGGNGKVALKFFIENNQNIEVGIDNQDTETDRWTIFRDFTLKYYGPDNEILEGDLDGNGTVDAIDLEMMVKLVLGKRVEGTTVEPGTVSLSDITKLVNNMTQNP